MNRLLLGFGVAAWLVVLSAAHVQAQLPPEKALATMQTAPGVQVELFAAEPLLLNPTSIDVDQLGRVWVCEAVNYRRVKFNRPILREEGDRIVILTDTTGDGKADQSQVFYQGKDLVAPIGIAVLPYPSSAAKAGFGYKVYVCQSPNILLFDDKDGDGQADGPPEIFLSGFRGEDHDHGVHGIMIGPDGKLYFTVGDAGVDGLQSKEGTGKNLNPLFPPVEDGKVRKWTSNTTDCRAGTVWRCDLDGNNLELIAHNFRNNYEATVDSFGEIWLSDNDDDGNQQTRICHVYPGGNYGYHPRGPGQSHWHEEQPGIVHKTMRTGFGSPTGICFYEGNLLPEAYRGDLLHADAGPREIRYFKRIPKGAGYELEKTVILTSSDNWFRPSDVCVAPDGSVIVADWYDPGVGGHGMGDWTRGRIYRLTPTGHKGYKVPEVKLDTKEGVLAALGSPNLSAQGMAKEYIKARTPEKRSEITRAASIDSKDDQLRARAAWLIDYNDPDSNIMLGSLFYDKDERFRALDMRWNVHSQRVMIEDWGTYFEDNSKSPAVLREGLIYLRQEQVGGFEKHILKFAKLYDGNDHFYRAALNIACGTDPARRDAILADFEKHFPEWNDKVADLVWELRPKSMLPRMEQLLGDNALTAAQKARIVDILAVNDDPAAGKTLLQLLRTDAPGEVKTRALENLRLFLPTKWNSISQGDELASTTRQLLSDSGTAVLGLQLVGAAQQTSAIDTVAKMMADSTKDAAVRLEAVRTLGQLRHVKAVAALTSHAEGDSESARAAIAALGNQIAGRGDGPAAQQALKALQAIITDGKRPAAMQQAAIQVLAGSRPGTGWLLSLQEKKEFPAAHVAYAGRLLRNSPFQGERNKALLLFPAPGKLDMAKLPPLAELVKRPGDARAGQEIMARSLTSEVQCLKCHGVRGVGGQIGPDLSMIGKKASKEDLFKSILQPSAAIADQYVTWKIDTVDGQSISGLIVGETAEQVTLRDANGKDYAIPAKDIESRSKSLVSLMPDNLAVALTEDELVDLVAYMATLQKPSLAPESWLAFGPISSPNGALPEAVPMTAGDWKRIHPDATGYVDLVAFGKDKSSNSYTILRQTIESPVAQEAVIFLGTDDGCRLRVNGELVLQHDRHEAARPGRDRVTVPLKTGQNTILLMVGNGNNPHGFFFSIESEQELKTK